MKTAQSQLELISRNISNVDTAGYTRKTANQKNVIVGGFSQGVSLGNVTRQVDEGLLKSYLVSSSSSSSLSAQSDYLSKTESLLGSPSDKNSLAANVADCIRI
jgi:flagellar hook-associated protein 1 FlgK